MNKPTEYKYDSDDGVDDSSLNARNTIIIISITLDANITKNHNICGFFC